MSKQIIKEPSVKSKRKSNISLPEKCTPLEITSVQRRNTFVQSNNAAESKKIVKIPLTPTIPEDATIITDSTKNAFSIEDESKKSKVRKSSVNTSQSKLSYCYDNKAYNGSFKQNVESVPSDNGIGSTGRAPSVQSLTYREQYCCFARRTKCERYLLISVTVLAIIVVVLVIVIIILANHNKINTLLNIK